MLGLGPGSASIFKDREALLAALADLWEAHTTAGLIAATLAYAETETEAMLNVVGCFFDEEMLNSRLEVCVRGRCRIRKSWRASMRRMRSDWRR